MIVSCPDSTVDTLPETGQSTNRASTLSMVATNPSDGFWIDGAGVDRDLIQGVIPRHNPIWTQVDREKGDIVRQACDHHVRLGGGLGGGAGDRSNRCARQPIAPWLRSDSTRSVDDRRLRNGRPWHYPSCLAR